MPNEADILPVRRSSKGVLIAVGLPMDGGVFFQEYWINGIPHYLIVNTSAQPARITISEWNGAKGRPLLGPWTISSNAVQDFNIESLKTDYSGPLVTVSLNDDPVYGLLKSPTPPALRLDEHSKSIVTSYGLNGIGDRHSNLLCFQEAVAFNYGEIIPLILRVPVRTGVISFKLDNQYKRLSQAVVVDAESNTLSVKHQAGNFIIDAMQDQYMGFHEIRLEVQLPQLGAESLAALWGHVTSSNSAGYWFGRGLVMRSSSMQ